MELLMQRFHSSDTDSLTLFFIDQHFAAFVVEDEKRDVKVAGETRIPAGRYQIILENSPKFTPRYGHKMLTVKDVPGFTAIRIHIGNNEGDTEGCILLGGGVLFSPYGRSSITLSTLAYGRTYPKIAGPINAGQEVWLTIRDEGFLFPPAA